MGNAFAWNPRRRKITFYKVTHISFNPRSESKRRQSLTINLARHANEFYKRPQVDRNQQLYHLTRDILSICNLCWQTEGTFQLDLAFTHQPRGKHCAYIQPPTLRISSSSVNLNVECVACWLLESVPVNNNIPARTTWTSCGFRFFSVVPCWMRRIVVLW